MQYAVEEGLVNERVLDIIYENPELKEFPLTIRILAADSGKIVRARVQVRKFLGSMGSRSSPWFVTTDGSASISGVPGTSSAVDIENPLHGDILPTGRTLDQIILDGDQVWIL
jgi:2-methylaconitate cis-trans-isomerase PrpF